MNKDEIRTVLEEVGVEKDKLEEAVEAVSASREQEQPAENMSREATEIALKCKLDSETDWRKRAAIAARIISLNL